MPIIPTNGCLFIMHGECVRYTGQDLPFLGIQKGMDLNEIVNIINDAIQSGLTTTTTTSTSTTSTTSSTTTTTTTIHTVPVTIGYLGVSNVTSYQVQLLQSSVVKANYLINSPSGSGFSEINIVPGIYDVRAAINLLNNQKVLSLNSEGVLPSVVDSFTSSIDRTYTNRLITNPSQIVLSDLGNTTTTSSTTTTTTTAAQTTTTTTTTSSTTTTTTTQGTTTTSTSTSTTSTTSTSTSSTTTTTSTNGQGGQVFTITGTGNDRRSIDGSTYPCGATIILAGTFKALEFVNLNGCNGNPILITNPVGQTTLIGDAAWNGGAWSTALAFRNCHYIKLQGTTQNNFVISGTEVTGATSAYFNLAISNKSDNFEVSNLTITKGGTGLWCKTEPNAGDTTTYDPVGGPYTFLQNFKIHDLVVHHTGNEALYVGHTGTYWDLTINQQSPASNPSQWIAGHSYAEPLRLKYVEIYNVTVYNSGNDAIQTAAAENMVIHHNEVYNYGTNSTGPHSAGLLIGGKTANVDAYCNYVHDGYGELLQVHGTGYNGGYMRIHNNLFKNNNVDMGLGVSGFDGTTFKPSNGLIIEFYDNTVVQTGGNNMRFYTGTGHLINRNVLIQPRVAGGTISARAYIYDEPGASWIEGTGSNANGKYPDVTTANVDPLNYYAPNPGSPATGKGYVRGVCDGTGTTTTSSTSSTSSTSTTSSTTTTTTTVVTTTTTSTSTSSTSTTSTSSTSSTTTTSTTSAGGGQFFKMSGWKTGSPNQYGWMYLPPNYNPTGTAYPFVIFLHGQGQVGSGSASADGLLTMGPPKFLNAGDRPQDIIIFSPQTNINTWEPSDVEFARSYMLANYNVDVDRFYLTGLSLGGSGTSKYVGTYPDRVAAYLVATGDTQWQWQPAGTGYLGPNGSLNGVRQADVPGWFHSGMADTQTYPGGGYSAMTAMNNISPKPIYPYLVNIYWGLTHAATLWDNEVYNRKNRTDTTGLADFDYIDWFKQFKRNDLQSNATSLVVKAESSNDWNDYRIALRVVNLMTAGTPKTNLLNRLSAVKATIETSWKVIELNFGTTTVSGNFNNLTTLSSGQAVNNMIDVNGGATTIDFTITTNVWSGDVSLGGLNHEYQGMPLNFWARAYRINKTGTPTETWTIGGLNNAKTYKIRLYPAFVSQATNEHRGITATVGATSINFDNEIQNTNRYLEFTNLTPSSGNIVMSVAPLVAGQYGDVAGIVIFESVSGGTTTTSTSTSTTTTTTTSSTSTTTTTAGPTTTTTSTSTTSTSTTTSSTTTTTTTASPGIAQFNFNATAQSVPGWTNVSGNPGTAVVTATHSGTGITISTVATNRWGSVGGTTGNNTNGSVGSNAEFPADVLISYMFSGSLVSATTPNNLEIGGLVPGNIYEFRMMGGRSSTAGTGIPAGQNRLMEWVCTDAVGTEKVENYACRDNTTNIQVFTNKVADGAGKITLGVFQDPQGNGTNGDQIGYINGLRIIPL